MAKPTIKDERYKAVKLYIEAREAVSLRDVFKIISISAVAKDAGINHGRFVKKLDDPDRFLVKEIRVMSELFNVSEHEIYTLIQGLYKKVRKPK